MSTEHPLDKAIGYARRHGGVTILGETNAVRIGELAAIAGESAAAIASDSDDWDDRDLLNLACTANRAMRWAEELTEIDPDAGRAGMVASAVRDEYDRANAKHNGNTPLNPDMSDDDRAAILLEEVGEVARSLTPDSDTPVGHGGDLREELIQTATMALAWLARLLDNEEADR